MKTAAVLILVIGIVYGVYAFSTSLIVGSFESIDYGLKFTYPSSLAVNERVNRDLLEIGKGGKEGESTFVFIKKYKHGPGSELSYRLPGEFGKEMLNEDHVVYRAINGLSFNWQGANGLERAFAFEAGDRDYIVSTFGLPDKDTDAAFDLIVKSLLVTYE